MHGLAISNCPATFDWWVTKNVNHPVFKCELYQFFLFEFCKVTKSTIGLLVTLLVPNNQRWKKSLLIWSNQRFSRQHIIISLNVVKEFASSRSIVSIFFLLLCNAISPAVLNSQLSSFLSMGCSVWGNVRLELCKFITCYWKYFKNVLKWIIIMMFLMQIEHDFDWKQGWIRLQQKGNCRKLCLTHCECDNIMKLLTYLMFLLSTLTWTYALCQLTLFLIAGKLTTFCSKYIL